MKIYQNFDDNLKTAISETVDNITVSQNMFAELNKKINNINANVVNLKTHQSMYYID